jgi:peptidoglycan hydrolase CwlO-like protein
MSEEIIVCLISAAVSLIAIAATSKDTRNKVMNTLETNQQITNTEIVHIKESITEMKADIKSHNHYAQLFNENIPVIKEQIKVANNRIKDLEHSENND